MKIYILIGLAILALGVTIGYRWEASRYDGLQVEFEKYKTQAAQNKTTEESSVVTELKRQLAQKSATELNNERVLQQVVAERDTVAAGRQHDADLIHRLLSKASQTNGTSCGVSSSDAESSVLAQKQAREAAEIEGLVRDTLDEVRDNYADHDALIDQLLPQLEQKAYQ